MANRGSISTGVLAKMSPYMFMPGEPYNSLCRNAKIVAVRDFMLYMGLKLGFPSLGGKGGAFLGGRSGGVCGV